MLATAEDVGIFLRALNDGSVFDEGEQEIYSSIYVYEHAGWVPGYQSIAKYHEDIEHYPHFCPGRFQGAITINSVCRPSI